MKSITDVSGATNRPIFTMARFISTLKALLTKPGTGVPRTGRILMRILLAHLVLTSSVLAASIHEACKNGNMEAVREILTDSAISPNARDQSGRTPLHLAVADGHRDIASLLLRRGADPNARDQKGFAPLHSAAMKGYERMISLLIEAGAEVNTKANQGTTPLDWGKSTGNPKVLRLLFESGGFVKDRGKDPFRAAFLGNEEILSAYLRGGGDPNADDRGPKFLQWRLLHWATAGGR